MASKFIKKENLTISVGEYQDKQGNTKQQWKTIGELISMVDNNGQPYQFFKLWGASGVQEGRVFQQQQNNQQQSQPQQQNTGYNNNFDDDIPFS